MSGEHRDGWAGESGRHHILQPSTTTASRAAFAAIFLLLSATAVAAGPLEDASAAYLRGDYVTALRLVRPLADQGSAPAQNRLGVMYSKGEGVAQDHAEAAKWVRLAADQGYPPAQNNLGIRYSRGEGVPQDHAEAVKWFRLAAD